MEEFRGFKKSYSILAVSYLVFGLVLLIWPDISMKTFCYVLGVGAIIFGIVHIIIYFTKDRILTMMQMDLVMGIIGVAAGIFVLIKPAFIISIIPFVIGIALILGAVIKFQNSLDLKKLKFTKWWILLILAILMLALGVLLIVNPFKAMATLVILIGCGLAADGIISIWSMFMIRHMIKKENKYVMNSDSGDTQKLQRDKTKEQEKVLIAEKEDEY